MRSVLLPIFGAAVSLGVSGARVSCHTEHVPATVSSEVLLAEVTKDCITETCVTGMSYGTVSEQCGSVVLAITLLHNDTLPTRVNNCVDHFQDIIDQCLTTSSEGFPGGASETDQVVYNISVDKTEGESGRHTLQARRGGRGRTRTRRAPVPKTRTGVGRGKAHPKSSLRKVLLRGATEKIQS